MNTLLSQYIAPSLVFKMIIEVEFDESLKNSRLHTSIVGPIILTMSTGVKTLSFGTINADKVANGKYRYECSRPYLIHDDVSKKNYDIAASDDLRSISMINYINFESIFIGSSRYWYPAKLSAVSFEIETSTNTHEIVILNDDIVNDFNSKGFV